MRRTTSRLDAKGSSCCMGSGEVAVTAGDFVVETDNHQASVGDRAITISLAESPWDCQASVPPTPMKTAIKNRGKGADSPANRRPVARDLIILEAGGARRPDRRFHGPSTNALIGHGVQIERLCERWALRVIHWVLHRRFCRKRPSWFDRSEARAQQSWGDCEIASVTTRAIKFPLVETN